MTWDTRFHKEQDAFRREHRKLPKYLYAGTDERKLFTQSGNSQDSYGGVPIIWVTRRNWFKFHV